MPEAFIVDAVRTPVGRRGGALSTVHPADLGAHSIKALIERTGVDPGAVDDCIFGNVDSIGPQAGCIARTAWLTAGLPEHVPGTTIDRQCGSAQQAVHFAAQAVMSGTMDLVVAGGVQNMSMIPISSAMTAGQALGFDDPFTGSTGWTSRYGNGEVNQFVGAEMMVKKWNITREEMEEFAVNSHLRALRAREEGRFDGQIAPLNGLTFDEGPREPNWDKIRSLPTLTPDGRITAACASQLSDASASLLIASEQAIKDHGLTPRARIHHISVLADDPIMMLSAPIPATKRALAKTGLTPDDIDLVEIRGVRTGGSGVAQRDRLRLQQGQCERWGYCPRTPTGRHWRTTDDHLARRARAHGRPLRLADHVRGRRPGQRHHHRTPLIAAL